MYLESYLLSFEELGISQGSSLKELQGHSGVPRQTDRKDCDCPLKKATPTA